MEQMMKIFHSTPVPMLILDENLLVGKALNCKNTCNAFMECGQGNLCPNCEMQATLKEVICTDKCIQNAEIPYNLMISDVQVSFDLRINAIPIVMDQIKYIAVRSKCKLCFNKQKGIIYCCHT